MWDDMMPGWLRREWQLWVRFGCAGWVMVDFYETWQKAEDARPAEISRGAKEYKIVRVEVLA